MTDIEKFDYIQNTIQKAIDSEIRLTRMGPMLDSLYTALCLLEEIRSKNNEVNSD